MHREIAITKITAYLARNPAVDVGDLPVRNVGNVAPGALVRVGDNDYQDYANFIRNHVGYTANALNAFVGEMVDAKMAVGALAQINV